jgi:hypothetical protein
MRGYVYRPGRRRTASIVLALGAAAAFAGGASATAMAKPPSAMAKPAAKNHAAVKTHSVVAHATGHKIA